MILAYMTLPVADAEAFLSGPKAEYAALIHGGGLRSRSFDDFKRQREAGRTPAEPNRIFAACMFSSVPALMSRRERQAFFLPILKIPWPAPRSGSGRERAVLRLGRLLPFCGRIDAQNPCRCERQGEIPVTRLKIPGQPMFRGDWSHFFSDLVEAACPINQGD